MNPTELPSLRLVFARDVEAWTIHRVTSTLFPDGRIVRDLTISRERMAPARLPAVLLPLLNTSPME